jgi:hypothetical protein
VVERKGGLRVSELIGSCAAPAAFALLISAKPGKAMVITAAHITPVVALIAGILILIMPRLLNYIVAIYLIFVGLVGLNSVHHFINWH